MIGEHLVDQAHRLGLSGWHAAPRVSQFPTHPLGNEFGEALEGAHISRHADIDLLDAEEGVRGRIAHVARCDHVHRSPNASALNGCQYWHAGLLQGREGLLEV